MDLINTYTLDFLGRDRLDSLGLADQVIRLTGLDNAGTSKVNGRFGKSGLIEQVEPGISNGLGDSLLTNGAVGDLLEGNDSSVCALADRRSGTRKLNGQETSVRVSQVGGGGRQAGETRGFLRQQAKTGGPFDGGSATEKSSKDSNLRLRGVQVGTGKSDHDGVAASV